MVCRFKFFYIGFFVFCSNLLFSMVPKDFHSFARPEEAIIKHLDLDIEVDFSRKIIHGKATIHISFSEGISEIWLDTKNLEIQKVQLDNGENADFKLLEEKQFLGTPLRISFIKGTKFIVITYTTSPQAAALQWLNPEQTEGKKYPFLFTQGQAILSRTWLPIQDSPGIRFSWSASVKVPRGYMALMSGTNPQKINPDGIYHFRMEKPVPAYLIALASGNIVFNQLGLRTGVYAEPEMIEKASFELVDTEEMLRTAEKLYGPYQWGRYDLIILPPSFPFGGMENPMLTFATPTIIAGDRSLTSLVAHELAHSWSGNLVTNSTWNDFWLNEGFTVYFERRIMEAIYGRDYSDMLSELGYQDLQKTLAELGHDSPDTKLKLNLENRDPDDGMNDIAYEKGYFFLKSIEILVGRSVFDKFLKSYFAEFGFRGIDTERFIEYLRNTLGREFNDDFQAENWIYKPGIPQNCPIPQSRHFDRIDQVRQDFLNGKDFIKDKNWTTHEWLYFIRKLPENISLESLKKLDEICHFSQSGNSEIQAAWFEKIIPTDYAGADIFIEKFLCRVGRRKFVLPLYKSMLKSQRHALRAVDIYKRARSGYHAVTAQSVDLLFKNK